MLIRASGPDLSASASRASARTDCAASVDGGTMIDGALQIPMPGASADEPRAVL
jgi:hypothetical protein